MKRLAVALSILAVILIAGILETVYIDKIFNELDRQLYAAEPLMKEESEEALTKTREISAWWENKRKYMELFTYSPDIRAFSVALAEAEGSLERGDFDNAASKWQSLISISKNLHQILDFNAEDII